METDETRMINDAYLGKDMEAYRKIDASLHPEQKPPRFNVGLPPELTQTPKYQEFVGMAEAHAEPARQLRKVMDDVLPIRGYWLDRRDGKTMFKDSEAARQWFGKCAFAVGHQLAAMRNEIEKHEALRKVAQDELAKLEREHYESQPEVFGKAEGGHA